MSRPSNIPEILVLPLFQEWMNGKNGEELVKWLMDVHNVKSSITAVHDRIKYLREIELQAKREAVASKASDQALDYFTMTDKDIIRLEKKISRLLLSDEKDDIVLADKLMNTKNKLINTQNGLMDTDKSNKTEQNPDFTVNSLINKLGKSN